tara:strand:- start:79 stop:309 length:231 start_codon:yes stop_codon:yes gene_type:complete
MGLKEYEEGRKRKASQKRLMSADAVANRRARRAKLKSQREAEDYLEMQTGLGKRIQSAIERAEQSSVEQSSTSEDD